MHRHIRSGSEYVAYAQTTCRVTLPPPGLDRSQLVFGLFTWFGWGCRWTDGWYVHCSRSRHREREPADSFSFGWPEILVYSSSTLKHRVFGFGSSDKTNRCLRLLEVHIFDIKLG